MELYGDKNKNKRKSKSSHQTNASVSWHIKCRHCFVSLTLLTSISIDCYRIT